MKVLKHILRKANTHFLVGILLFLFVSSSYGTTYTSINSGNWSTSATWLGGNKPPTSGNSSIINIAIGDTVILNSSISFGNTCELYVYGKLTINGNLEANNNLIISVAGSLIVNGDLQSKNGAGIKIYIYNDGTTIKKCKIIED